MVRLVNKHCTWCGRYIKNVPENTKYCGLCRKEHDRAQAILRKRNRNKVTIKITEYLDVFDSMRPPVGSEWVAVKCLTRKDWLYIIKISGKELIIRKNECMEV